LIILDDRNYKTMAGYIPEAKLCNIKMYDITGKITDV